MKNLLSKTTMDFAMAKAIEYPYGKQLHFNHEDCPAGEDTRERLSVKVTDDSRLVLAHCFNCGGAGVRSLGTSYKKKVAPVDRGEYTEALDRFNRHLRVYMDFASHTQEWSDKEWPEKYFTDCHRQYKLADRFGIIQTGNATYIPRGNPPGDITGFEVRYTDTSISKMNRYNRVLHPDHKDESKLLIYNPEGSRKGVVCEDPISAMKISLTGYAGVCLCGSSLSPDDAFKLGILFDSLIVWLDNDNDTVNRQSLLALARLQLFMDNVYREVEKRDPKLYTLYEIVDTIEGFKL